MRHYGFRRTTRKKLKQPFRKTVPNNLQVYKNNDYVDIVINPAFNKSMPHKVYHGRTGKVYKVDERFIGVLVKRVVGNKELLERLEIRKEHLKPSNCRKEFEQRIEAYKNIQEEASKNNTSVPSPKRVLKGARQEAFITLNNNVPIKVGFKKYCDLF